jgi:glycine cleavage system H protein
MRNPQKLRYTRDHEWLDLQGDVGTVGITDFAQKELGDIVYVELPAKGAAVRAGKELGSVESVKAVSEIFSPVEGEVIDANTALTASPETLNRDPYGEGWIVKVRIKDPSQAAKLMDLAAYEAYVKGEGKGG